MKRVLRSIASLLIASVNYCLSFIGCVVFFNVILPQLKGDPLEEAYIGASIMIGLMLVPWPLIVCGLIPFEKKLRIYRSIGNASLLGFAMGIFMVPIIPFTLLLGMWLTNAVMGG